MDSKRFLTYEEITRITGRVLQELVDSARESAKAGHPQLVSSAQVMACGAYSLWDELTVGWQTREDLDRFEKLSAADAFNF
jgi:hypothetical protein